MLIFLFYACEQYEQDCTEIDNCNDHNLTYFDLVYPSNFPSPNIPNDNPTTFEGVNLGRHLFYDPIFLKSLEE